MKQIIIILALALIVTTSFAITPPKVVSNRVLNSFNSEFVGASDVTWIITKDLYKVTFSMNQQKLVAYFNNVAEFLAVTRNISSEQLPNNLKKSLKKIISNRWITDLFEITNFENTSWYVTLETADEKLVLKSDCGEKWEVFQMRHK